MAFHALRADPGTGQPGTIYLLHFSRPFGHARHYTGWTGGDLEIRLADHAAGRGSRLCEAAIAAGVTWTLAATEPGDRNRERQLKNRGGASRRCPICHSSPLQEGSAK